MGEVNHLISPQLLDEIEATAIIADKDYWTESLLRPQHMENERGDDGC